MSVGGARTAACGLSRRVKGCRALGCSAAWEADFSLPFSSGCVPVQRCADDPTHHGELRVPQVGPGSGLAHGAVFHGPHSRLHGLYVPHLEGLPEAGKSCARLTSRGFLLRSFAGSLCVVPGTDCKGTGELAGHLLQSREKATGKGASSEEACGEITIKSRCRKDVSRRERGRE